MTDSDSDVAHGEGETETEIPLWSFRLGFGPFAPRRPNDANYAAYMRVKTRPPLGCTFREDYGFARLECRWPGPDRLAAVGRLVREIRTAYGLVGTDDLGIERLGEWAPGDREWAECTVGQLLLMGAGRAEQLGYGLEEVLAFVRDAMAPPLTPRQAAGRLQSGEDDPEGDDPDEGDPEEDSSEEDCSEEDNPAEDDPEGAGPDGAGSERDGPERDGPAADDAEPSSVFGPASGSDPIGGTPA